MIGTRTELISAIRELSRSAKREPALIFNCHITGLAVARSLGRHGVPVIGLDRDEKAYGIHSRYTAISGRCPYPLEDENGFIELLLAIGAALDRKAVLFPCLDEWVFAVARHRLELEEFFLLPFSELDTVERILDKSLLYRKSQELGIPIPRTFYVGEQSPDQIGAQISFPCIIKPALQRAFTNEFGEKVFRVENHRQLREVCDRAAHHPLLAQEIVGSGVDSFYSMCSYVGRDNEAKGVFVGRKLEQYPPDFGTACLVDSRFVSSVVERGIQILKQLEYYGISEVEFIYDERDNEFKLLDVNTRVWKWIGLPIFCGVDLPWLAYLDAVKERVEPALLQREGVRWVYLKDYISLRRHVAGTAETTLSREDWLQLIAGGADSMVGIVDAVFSNDDPEPFVRLLQGLSDDQQYYCAC